MTAFLKRISFSALVVVSCGASVGLSSEHLIEPTRSLEGPRIPLGRLTVVSEPPDLEVFLDDSQIGQSPVWLKEVKAGAHKVRVQDSEWEVYVEPGKTLILSFFKGAFIHVSPEKETAERLGPEAEKPTEGRKRMEPREKENELKDLTPWERFLNRTSPIF
jgi:hypothetical protein